MADDTGPFDTLLVANRGEIAVRILRTARAMGLRTVAVYSDADAGAPHTRAADRAIHIGPAQAASSYLDIGRLIEAAGRGGAQAVHPGYGFLSESAPFAAACRDAGLVFIGPSTDAIRSMGDKARAKTLLRARGVPVIPGYDGAAQDEDTLITEAARVGYPLMVKAVAGGGGKGMRLVVSPGELCEAIRGARSEAVKAFGDGTLMLEHAIFDARHVEVQVFGDRHGGVVHLGDRDCSIQRRHQKVIEEAPAPGLSDALRQRMGEAAVEAARSVAYLGAGTVEFLVTVSGDFHFLEMNTRLQVEHPVTESVTGLDLVEWQIRIARGEALPLVQDAVRITGHAIEARVYAEDPAAHFLPQSGRLSIWAPPEADGIRVDHGIAVGDRVTPFYDPMMAKVVASGADRETARRRLVRSLERFAIGGVRNNLGFLRECLGHEVFIDGRMHTGFVDRETFGSSRPAIPDRALLAIAAVLFEERPVAAIAPELRHWRSRPARGRPLSLEWDGGATSVGLRRVSDAMIEAIVRDEPNAAGTIRVGRAIEAGGPRFVIDGCERPVLYAWSGDALDLCGDGQAFRFEEVRPSRENLAPAGSALVLAPMPGSIVDVRVEVGSEVLAGDVLLVLEAMKMENQVQAPVAGRVDRLDVVSGQQVGLRQMLVRIVSTEPVDA